MKCYMVFDAPVPGADELGAEGGRLGATLLVDVHDFRDVVGEELNIDRSNKWKKGPAWSMDHPEL